MLELSLDGYTANGTEIALAQSTENMRGEKYQSLSAAYHNRDFVITTSYDYKTGTDAYTQLEDRKEEYLSTIAFPLYGLRTDEFRDVFYIDTLGVFVGQRFDRAFSSSDENMIREMLVEFMPLLYSKMSDEIRSRSVRTVRHELAYPTRAIDRLADIAPLEKSGRNYRDELKNYAKWLQNIVDSPFFFTGEDFSSFRREDRVKLITSDIIFPAIHQGLSKDDKSIDSKIIDEIDRNEAIRVFYRQDDWDDYKCINKSNDQDSIYSPRPKEMLVNKVYLSAVFFNLLSNSIKYSQEYFVPDLVGKHKPTVEKSHRLQVDILLREIPESELDCPGGLEILFRDYGRGIPRGSEEFIFNEGARCAEHANDVPGGGIGLWLVRKFVRAHEGKITVRENMLPTTFRIRFPKKIYEFPQDKKVK